MTLAAAGAWAPERRLLTAGLLGLVTAAAFEGMAVPTVLPATLRDLGDLELYGWAFAAFWLTNIIGITLGGTDADRRGPARSFAAGVLLFAAGMAISGLAPGMPVVIAGRAVQGFGSGAIAAVVYAAIARAYAPNAIPRMLALLSSAWIVPGLVGPALAAVVADALGWRWVFLGIVPPVIVMGLAVLPPLGALGPARSRVEAPRIDRRRALDAVGLAAGSTLLLGALTAGAPLIALGLGVPGAVLTVVTLRRLIPSGSLRLRAGRPAVIGLVFGVAFAFFGTEAFVPLAVVEVRGAPISVGGLALSAAAVTWATGSWLQARVAPRGTRRALVRGGGLLIGAGIAIVALVVVPPLPVAVAALGWAIAGLGMGLAYTTLSLLVLETAESGVEGASSTALNLMFTLGTAFGAGLGGAVIALADAGILALDRAILIVDGGMALAALAVAVMAGRVPAAVTARQPLAAAGEQIASPAGLLGGSRERT
ncbi:MAG: MFS transporter [Candidatus Limnocylindria bacterium]